MNLAVLHLASALLMQPAPATRITILPFHSVSVQGTDKKAIDEVEAEFRSAMEVLRGKQQVPSADGVRVDLGVARKVRTDLPNEFGPENVNLLPPMFNTGILIVGTVEGKYPDAVASFYAYDGATRSLRGAHVERFAGAGSFMKARMASIAWYLLSANAASGAIEASCEHAGPRLAVDGAFIVDCPGAVRLSPLAPGTYHVALEGAVGKQDDVEVSVLPGRISRVHEKTPPGPKVLLMLEDETAAMPGEYGTMVMALGEGAGKPQANAGGEKPPLTETSSLLYAGWGVLGGGAAVAGVGLFAALVGALGLALYPRSGTSFTAQSFEAGLPIVPGATALAGMLGAGVLALGTALVLVAVGAGLLVAKLAGIL